MPQTMKAFVKSYGQVGLKLITDAPVPTIGPQDVLIRVLAASICSSDVHIYHNNPLFRNKVAANQIIGHEFCGEIIEIGQDVTTVAVGDIVSAESHIVCRTCYYCLNGLSHICQEVSTIGFDRPGAFAEYVAIPIAGCRRQRLMAIAIAKAAGARQVTAAGTKSVFGKSAYPHGSLELAEKTL